MRFIFLFPNEIAENNICIRSSDSPRGQAVRTKFWYFSKWKFFTTVNRLEKYAFLQIVTH